MFPSKAFFVFYPSSLHSRLALERLMYVTFLLLSCNFFLSAFVEIVSITNTAERIFSSLYTLAAVDIRANSFIYTSVSPKQTVSWHHDKMSGVRLLSYILSVICARFISYHRQHDASCRCILHYADDSQCCSWPTGEYIIAAFKDRHKQTKTEK